MAIGDTSWQEIVPTTGDGQNTAVGRVKMVEGFQQRPCIMCRSFEKDEKRLVEHLLSYGLLPRPDGVFTSPIQKDFPDAQGQRRANMTLDPKEYGFCRFECRVVGDEATCEKWSARRSLDGLIHKIVR